MVNDSASLKCCHLFKVKKNGRCHRQKEDVMKKKLLALAVSTAMVLGLVGCGSNKEYRASDMSEYIELGEYTGFEIEMDVEVTDEEIQEEIKYILESAADYEQIMDGKVANEDRVNIDYSGVLEGETEPFEGGSDSDFDLVIGSHKFIDTFEEQLIGHAPGETVEVKATFPKDYGVEDLNGKTAIFTVTINYICGEKIVSEWTDEFVNEYTSGSHTTTADYEKYLRDYYTENKKSEAENNKTTEVLKRIIENSKVIKYSQEEVDEYYEDCMEYYTTMASTYYGCSLEEFTKNMMGMEEEQFRSEAADAAYQYVVGNIALLAIAYDQGISITQKEFDERLKKLADENGYESTDEVLEECEEYGDTYLWDEFLRDKALEYVLGTVIEV